MNTDTRACASLNHLELRLLGFFLLASTLFILVLGTAGYHLFSRYRPLISDLLALHLRLNKAMMVSIDDTFPVSTHFNQDVSVGLKTDIPIRVPISHVLTVPIDETFTIPFAEPFSVKLDHPLSIKGNVHVKTDLPLDTKIDVMIAGIKHRLPIKAVIPIDITFPMKESFAVDSEMSLHMVRPMAIHIKKTLKAPVKFVVEGVMPLNQRISVPVSADLACRVKMKHDLPLLMNLDMSLDDWGKGIAMRPKAMGISTGAEMRGPALPWPFR